MGRPYDPEVRETITEYAYCALPEDHPDAYHFTVHVRYRGHGRYAVTAGTRVLRGDGTWEWGEPVPSERDAEWLDQHRFDLDTARRLAREIAPTLSVNGWTLERVLARDAEERR